MNIENIFHKVFVTKLILHQNYYLLSSNWIIPKLQGWFNKHKPINIYNFIISFYTALSVLIYILSKQIWQHKMQDAQRENKKIIY